MADPTAVLRSFLLSHKLDESVVNFITASCSRGLGCESISDFAGYWTDNTADFYGDILAHIDAFKDKNNPSKIQLSRLRIAWQQAAGATGKAQPPSISDPEAPLSPEEAKAQETAWQSAGGFRFHPDEDPAANLKSRVCREFARRCRTVDDLSRMRSSSNTPAITPETRKQLGDISIIVAGGSAQLPALPLSSLMEVTRAHQIMANLWSVTGTAKVTSKLEPTKQITEAPYDVDLRCHTFFKSKMTEHPAYMTNNAAEVIRWALDRDQRTRSQAAIFYNLEGYSWGEALCKAQEILGVVWTVTEDAKVVLPCPPSHPSHPPPGYPAQRRSNSSSSSKPEFCKAWNTPQGCTQRQRDCPHDAEHKCSFLVQGEPCLKWTHNAVAHARWESEERRKSAQEYRKRSKKSFR